MKLVRYLVSALIVLAPAAAQANSTEDGVLAEINRARTDPAGFAADLERLRQSFDRAGEYESLGARVRFMSYEGRAAVDEAIRFLRRQRPLPPLRRGQLLAAAATDHTREQGPRGMFGHASLDGTMPGDRVMRRGGGDYVAETIAYTTNSPIDVVAGLIVDDNVPDRGHRAVIFDEQYRYAGAGCGPHTRWGFMCTVDFGRTPDGSYP
ncbi:CAP domain-containing protein [Sphingomonas solaris]|uniref:CAP domain-containing protein n=1 Tax=Alterirhizorhabdus solaris TaxID=2529389 RepID=A0A558RBY2_9SPHN|nr:CAP domain-containing protein [Sphingomonas solaris]TVV76861.1 CAP domain-containing protein [Sphingomonas solaris]